MLLCINASMRIVSKLAPFAPTSHREEPGSGFETTMQIARGGNKPKYQWMPTLR